MGTEIVKQQEKSEIIQAFLTSPTKYCKEISRDISTFEEATNAYPIHLSEWKRIDYNTIQALIVSFIHGMLRYFGRRKTDMDDFQVKTLVDDILSKYHYLNIEDVCLCFKLARMSIKTYGKFYGVIDGATIMGWFSTYDKQRDEYISNHNEIPEPEIYTDSTTREEYEENILAMAAGGDEFAYKAYQKIIENRRLFTGMRYEIGNYKYNRKHKFDEKPKRNER